MSGNVICAICYTVISIVRQYTLRRLFNGKSVWQSISGSMIGWQVLNIDFWRWLAARALHRQ
jgi:hypothetical protein